MDFDLEERTYKFAKRSRDFVKKLPRTISNIEYGKQLIRSSASVGANYIEANEHLGKKDFMHKIKICRKEAKESRFWLKLCITHLPDSENQQQLIQESLELTKIFGSIVTRNK